LAFLNPVDVVEAKNLDGYPAFGCQRPDDGAIELEVILPDLGARVVKRDHFSSFRVE